MRNNRREYPGCDVGGDWSGAAGMLGLEKEDEE